MTCFEKGRILRNGVVISLSNDDGEDNENSTKAISFWISKTTTLHVQHAFLYISLPSRHDYDVKCLISRFKQDVNRRQRLSFSFPVLWSSALELNSREICQHWTNWTRWNKREKVWGSANSLFKWRFRSHRRRCCLSCLIIREKRHDFNHNIFKQQPAPSQHAIPLPFFSILLIPCLFRRLLRRLSSPGPSTAKGE